MPAERTEHRVPLRAADCFLLASDCLMRRTGQGPQVTLSVLELDTLPDFDRLREICARMVEKHPLLVSTVHRNWRTWLPYLRIPARREVPLPLRFWETEETRLPVALLTRIAGEPLEHQGIPFRVRLHAVKRPGGRCLIGLAWSHLILDGKGAELLLAEIARLCDGVDVPDAIPAPPARALSMRELVKKSKGSIHRFSDLEKIGIASLGGPKPRAGRCAYQVITLSEGDTALLASRAGRMTGALFPLAFCVACAARAHDRVFENRPWQPPGYIASVPIQTRRRGAHGPLFHNHVSVLFFSIMREQLASLETAAAAMKQQFAGMARARLDESFNAVLEMMVRLPSRLFMRIVRWRFKGEVCSFYHSHTGPFAPDLDTFAGARIANAFHLPCLATPPGTGIFFSERGGRTTVVFTWRNGCLSDGERRAMVRQTLEDLLGAARPEMIDEGL